MRSLVLLVTVLCAPVTSSAQGLITSFDGDESKPAVKTAPVQSEYELATQAITQIIGDAYNGCSQPKGDTLKECRRFASIALSGRVCNLNRWRADVLDEIKTQRKYSSIGGSVNLTVMQALQLRLRAIDEKVLEVSSALKNTRAPRLSCEESHVKTMLEATCNDGKGNGCAVIKYVHENVTQDDSDHYITDTSYYMPTAF